MVSRCGFKFGDGIRHQGVDMDFIADGGGMNICFLAHRFA